MKANKYELKIFPNGRVYFLDKNLLNQALEAGKDILIICNAWSGGYAIRIGGDYIDDDYYGRGYMMRSCYVQEDEFDAETLTKEFFRVIITSGHMIYMNTHQQANLYQGGKLIDWDSSDEKIVDWYDFKAENYPTKKELEEEIYRRRTTVNDIATVSHLGRDKEKVQCLINYGILSKDAKKYC